MIKFQIPGENPNGQIPNSKTAPEEFDVFTYYCTTPKLPQGNILAFGISIFGIS
jgi:hypothetical protein